MKKVYFIIFLITLFVSCKKHQSNLHLPKNEKQLIVLDSSHLFSFDEKNNLAIKIINYEKKSTNQIAILTIDSLPKGISLLKYASDVANFWGVGQKDKDNGLLIAISKFDRDIAISTGYGTERIITDSMCQRIIDYTIIPQFKTKNYYKGINNALDSIIYKWN